MDNNLITEEFLREHGWINRPESAYTEDDIESGYIDPCLYITSPYANVCGQWCFQHRISYCRDGYWAIMLSGACLKPVSDIHEIRMKIRTVEDYNRIIDFCKSIDNNFPI